jgi:hypothetical protein
VVELQRSAGNAAVARMLQREPAAAPSPGVVSVGLVKHTFTVPDKKLGGEKDLGYAQAQFKVGGTIDLEITPLQAATTPGAPSGDVTLKGSGGVNAGDGTKYQAEVTAEFEKRVGGILDGCTPKAKVGGEVGGEGSKLGLEISLEGQRFEPKLGFTVLDVGKEEVKFATLEAAVDWKIHEWTYRASDGADIKIAPKATPKLAIEPNYKRIIQAVLEEGVEGAASLTLDAALVAGPPLLAAIVIAQGIYLAGEKGELHKRILTGAVDARQAAMSYALTMTGSEGQGGGPRTTAAIAQAKAQLGTIASRAKISVEELMTQLRKTTSPRDFTRVHEQARQEVFAAYDGEVRKVISTWRQEHYVLAWWTTQADDVAEAKRQVDVVFSH